MGREFVLSCVYCRKFEKSVIKFRNQKSRRIKVCDGFFDFSPQDFLNVALEFIPALYSGAFYCNAF